jgi:hypothetical protein
MDLPIDVNLSRDIENCEWIRNKIRSDEKYAQNVYSALCNIVWYKMEFLPTLKGDNEWTCTWRWAGGFVSDIRKGIGAGDYMEYYCSGIGAGLGNGDEDGTKGYVGESVVTEEVENDFKTIGWQWKHWPEDYT